MAKIDRPRFPVMIQRIGAWTIQIVVTMTESEEPRLFMLEPFATHVSSGEEMHMSVRAYDEKIEWKSTNRKVSGYVYPPQHVQDALLSAFNQWFDEEDMSKFVPCHPCTFSS